MNIAFSDISEECALELVHLVHCFGSPEKPVPSDPVDPLRTCPKEFHDKVVLALANDDQSTSRRKRGAQRFPCRLVNIRNGQKHQFDSMRDALRFLSMNPTGLTKRFAERMTIGEWKFEFN